MNNIELFQWGPLLLRQDIDSNITQNFLDNIKSTKEIEFENFVTSTSRRAYNNHLGLINSLRPYVKNYLKIAKLEENLFTFGNVWVNIYNEGDYVTPHVHENCDLSFVLFLQVPYIDYLNNPRNEGTLNFHYGEAPDRRARIPSISIHTILPKVNEMFIFPNNLLHYTVPIQENKIKRISVSGNITLK